MNDCLPRYSIDGKKGANAWGHVYLPSCDVFHAMYLPRLIRYCAKYKCQEDELNVLFYAIYNIIYRRDLFFK